MNNCLYNGVVLPATPTEWDKEIYPHAYVAVFKDYSGGRLILSTVPLTYTGYSEEANYFYGTADGTCAIYKLSISDGAGESYIPSTWEYYQNPSVSTTNFIRTGTADFIWTNTDTYTTTDGTLYLAASEPVPITTFNLHTPSFLKGLEIGRLLKARTIRNAMKPVEIPQTAAYCLYNGVKLPNIDTVWTEELKKTHPYAIVSATSATEVVENASGIIVNVILTSKETTFNGKSSVLTEGTDRLHWLYTNSQEIVDAYKEYLDYDVPLNEFILEYEGPEEEEATFRWEPLTWSSYDIINTTDNTIYLAASDPVPVYE